MSKNQDLFGEVMPIEKDQKADLKALLQNLKEAWSLHIELAQLRAKLDWELYTELKKAGFTAEQALQLVIEKGP